MIVNLDAWKASRKQPETLESKDWTNVSCTLDGTENPR
jgi:hypothetical protein